ncbi:hypothetical protein MYP_348 [Sporocytophaga myxococcoides]|uniref:Uncharacterized protein n=1 Tax=Sporocytophaga myxococcoides TaxID=153721 RepID=A0A098L954_9BACT|nr:hypothetical protein MYP_348 [Sporocytophaga myxococcoides]
MVKGQSVALAHTVAPYFSKSMKQQQETHYQYVSAPRTVSATDGIIRSLYNQNILCNL